MRNRIALSLAFAIVTIGLSTSLLQGQAASGKKVFGYQDSSGAFHPVTRAVPDAAATAPTTGTIQVTLNITVKSTFPSGTTRTILCAADVDATSLSTTAQTTNYTEAAFANATGSGTTYSCTLKIPYSWILPSTFVQRSLLGAYTVQVNNSNVSAGPAILRLTESDFVSTSTIPANGATSTYTVAVTI
jgi:hypothetical protein